MAICHISISNHTPIQYHWGEFFPHYTANIIYFQLEIKQIGNLQGRFFILYQYSTFTFTWEHARMRTVLWLSWHVRACEMATDRNAPQGVEKVHSECRIDSESYDLGIIIRCDALWSYSYVKTVIIIIIKEVTKCVCIFSCAIYAAVSSRMKIMYRSIKLSSIENKSWIPHNSYVQTVPNHLW